MKYVHVHSIVQSVFGVIDDEGNIVNKQPLSVEVPRFDKENFSQAHDALVKARDELNSKLEQK